MRFLCVLLVLLAGLYFLVAGPSIETAAQAPETLVFRVDQPNVNQNETPYPQYTFRSGDRVVVSGGGCVQTGGSGKTWKRYINPEGPNADRLYHGLISIPGATNGLIRIEGILGKEMIVSAVDPSRAFLVLGYEDDDYNDNGYSGHDDGTNDQYKGVGAAFVEVTVTRARPEQQASPQPAQASPSTGMSVNPSPSVGGPEKNPTPDKPGKGFFETIPGLITAIAGFITAISGLYLALRPKKK